MNTLYDKNLNDTVAIVVLSCDKYADLWKLLFFQFWKCWPDCPYKLYLGSNTKKYKDEKVQTILSGKDRDWSSSLLNILNKIPHEYIFLWLDDILPISKIDGPGFLDALHFMKQHKIKHILTAPCLKPDRIVKGTVYGEYERGAPYRISVFGFWEVKMLKKLLLPGETPWDFEIMGSYRSIYDDGFYCMTKPLFQMLNVVEKGKISREAYDYCQTHSIPLSTTRRVVLAGTSHLKSQTQKYYVTSVVRIPWRIRLCIMNILRKLLISY